MISCATTHADPWFGGKGTRPMKPDAAKTRFLERLGAAGLSLDTLTPAAGVEAMLAYYLEEPAAGCRYEADGDMLLFQWGTYTGYGRDRAFEVSITRQLNPDDDEEDEMRQLRLTFRYAPAAGETAGRGASKWCASPSDLAAFRRYVAASRAMAAVGQQPAESVELVYGRT